MLEAVIFDLDGVITDSAAYHFRAWKEIADRLSIPFDETYNEKLKGVSRMESLALILDRGKGRNAYSDTEKEQLAFEKNEIYKKMICAITPADPLPGIRDILEALKQNSIPAGLASVSKNAAFIIEQLQIGSYFSYIADAANVAHSKPAPDIFDDCIRHLSVNPAHSVGIEDARVGIEAIHRAGMRAVGVGTRSEMAGADLILESTTGLRLPLLQALVP